MAQQRDALVGRAPALAVLHAACSEAAAGHGGLVLVAGEAGIGKTSLVAALAQDVAAAGTLVLWGQCWDGDGAPAYWPWVQVLRAGIAAGADPGQARSLLPGSARTATPERDGQRPRFELFDAMWQHLVALAGEQPVVAVLDDLQWADDASLAMVEFCARHVQTSRVLLVGTYREQELTPALTRVAAAGRVLPLGGLSPADVTSLVAAVSGAQTSAPVGEAVWRRTAGNPLFVGEVVRLLSANDALDDPAAAQGLLPQSVREVLERRLARLSPPCADLLTVAAVAGPQVRVDLLMRLAADPAQVGSLLGEAEHAGVLVASTAAGRAFRFSHDLFRQTVLQGLSGRTERGLHLALARELEELLHRGASVHPAELAAHFVAAADDAREQAVRYSALAAAEATARLAFSDACAHHRRALAALDPAEESYAATRLGLLLDLGAASARAGDAPGALDAYREAARLAGEQDDPTGLARAAIGVHVLGWRHSHAVAIDLLEQAVRALPPGRSALRARVLASLARDLHHATDEQDWARAGALAQQSVTEAVALGDPATEAFCLLALHDAQWRPGTAQVRLDVVERMCGAARAAGDRELVAQSRLLRAAARIELGDPRGTADLEAYCRLSDELGHAKGRYGARSRRATLALLTGGLDDAQRLAWEACELGSAIGEPDAAGVRETLLWAVARVTGAPPAGVSLDSEPWPLPVSLPEAVVHVSRGEIDAARDILAPLRVETFPRTYDLELLAFAAWAVAAAGTPEQRTQLYALLAPYAGSHIVVGGCASYLGVVDHYLGLLARADGRAEDARQHFDRAVELHDRLGAPAWSAMSQGEAEACRASVRERDGVFHRQDGVWHLAYRAREAHLPDAKGLRDLAALLSRPGQPVSAVQLHTGRPLTSGADPVLDGAAKAAYRRRLGELESEIDEAADAHDLHRAEQAQAERDALVAELVAATGLGGRDRRLGDASERARKAVTARIHDVLHRIERVHPDLAAHLHTAVQTGAWCTYAPEEPVRWRL